MVTTACVIVALLRSVLQQKRNQGQLYSSQSYVRVFRFSLVENMPKGLLYVKAMRDSGRWSGHEL